MSFCSRKDLFDYVHGSWLYRDLRDEIDDIEEEITVAAKEAEDSNIWLPGVSKRHAYICNYSYFAA